MQALSLLQQGAVHALRRRQLRQAAEEQGLTTKTSSRDANVELAATLGPREAGGYQLGS